MLNDNSLGKFLLLIIIIIITTYNTCLGFLVVLLLISLLSTPLRQGFSAPTLSTSPTVVQPIGWYM